MRLATWNVNSVKARLPRLLGWLAETKPDIVCLQETKCPADRFPAAEVGELGYASAAHGDGRWNGVALLSRVGIEEVSLGFPGEPGFGGDPGTPGAPGDPGTPGEAEQPYLLDEPGELGPPRPEARAIGATCGGLRVWSLYAPNGRTPDSPHYLYKLDWFAALRTALGEELERGHAPTDADVWDPAAFVDSTHVTPPERRALAELRALGLHDVVPVPMKGPFPYTYWDYRAGMFHQNKGMRIDLVYADAAVTGRVRSAYVDREARKGKGPSDHAPIVVDLV
jgi:exodeoxyribonuclease-3